MKSSGAGSSGYARCASPVNNTRRDKTMIQPKVAAGGAAGAASVVLVWVAGLFGLDVPAEVASAFTVLLSFAAAYLKA